MIYDCYITLLLLFKHCFGAGYSYEIVKARPNLNFMVYMSRFIVRLLLIYGTLCDGNAVLLLISESAYFKKWFLA